MIKSIWDSCRDNNKTQNNENFPRQTSQTKGKLVQTKSGYVLF